MKQKRVLLFVILVFALLLAACQDAAPRACTTTAEAPVRQDANMASTVVDTVPSGTWLPVTAAAPGWYKTATSKLVEGWVDSRLCPGEVD